MSKNRIKQRANKKREELIDKRNAFGMCDPTPFRAVLHIREKQLKERRENK